MKPEGFEIPPLRIPLVPRTQRIPRTGDEQSRQDPKQPGRRRKEEPEAPRPAPNSENTGHGIDLET